MSYGPQQQMSAPSPGGAELWRTALGAVASVALYAWGLGVVAGLLAAFGGPDLVAEMAAGATARGTLLVLFTFALMAAGPLMLARPLHRRSMWSLIGPRDRAARDFFRAARALVFLWVVLWLVLPEAVALDRGLDTRTWILLLPLTLTAVLVQSASEEIAFRGYLQSQLASRIAAPAVWLGVPAALFAWGHYSPETTGENAGWLAAAAFVFALAVGDLTARTGTLGAAVAFHFMNNVAALAVTALPGAFSGLALTLLPFGADAPEVREYLWLDVAVIGVEWLAVRLALRV